MKALWVESDSSVIILLVRELSTEIVELFDLSSLLWSYDAVLSCFVHHCLFGRCIKKTGAGLWVAEPIFFRFKIFYLKSFELFTQPFLLGVYTNPMF